MHHFDGATGPATERHGPEQTHIVGPIGRVIVDAGDFVLDLVFLDGDALVYGHHYSWYVFEFY